MFDVKQMEKIVPLITCEISLCQYVCELVFGVDTFDLNLRIQIDSVKQPVRSNSVGSWNMSHCWTPACDYHLDHGFIVLKNEQHSTGMKKCHVRRHTANLKQIKNVVLGWNLGLVLRVFVWCGVMQQVSLYRQTFGFIELVLGTMEHFYIFFKKKNRRSGAGIPSVPKPASREIISASVELCETEVCLLHIQLIGTNVWLPKMHKIPPDVDFESSGSRAKSESWNNPNLHCCAVFPTLQYCLN